jgi:hypothetical protein
MLNATVLTDRFDRALLYATHVRGRQVRKRTSIPYVAHHRRATCYFDDTPNCDWCDDRPKSLVVRWEFAQGGVITLDGGAEHPQLSHPDEFFDKPRGQS